ncbi:hypothetical protein Tco_0751190 [Tanacetum coccineum]|uniref:Uncharacterized protein n=1 Tax=Tanacetum coccineum TaxID=301880 RepID=A0ABQ4Z3C8_9ASTR
MLAFYRFRHNSCAYLSGSLSNGHAHHVGLHPTGQIAHYTWLAGWPSLLVYSQLYYHYIPFRGKKSSSRPSVDTSKATYIQCRRSLLHFSLSTSGLTISASTHLRNLYISKKIPSQCRYQVHTLDSSNLSSLTNTPTILGLDTSPQ